MKASRSERRETAYLAKHLLHFEETRAAFIAGKIDIATAVLMESRRIITSERFQRRLYEIGLTDQQHLPFQRESF